MSDAPGHRVATQARDRVQVWQVAAMQWTHVCDIAAPEDTRALAISADGRLVAHSYKFQSVITDVTSGRPLLEIPDHPFAQAAFHPSGEWLASEQGLICFHKAPYWRRFVERPIPSAPDLAAMQRGESPRPVPVQGTFTVGFSRDGRWFWRGTTQALFVYEWSAIGSEQPAELPNPTWRFALPLKRKNPFEIVQAVIEEPDEPAVVFGGTDGRLYRLNLESGRVRELIELPSACHVKFLTFSSDGSSLGVVSDARPVSAEAPEIGGTIWEVWNYPRLRDGGAATSAAS